MMRSVAASGRFSTDTILLLAALAATIYSLYLVLDPESFTIRAIKHAAGDPLPGRVLVWEEMDRIALSAAREQPQQNFVGDLMDNRSSSPANRFVASMFYVRATYALWPRRMYITYPSVVIVGGDQLARAPLPRDPQWMSEHHAGSIVQFQLHDLKPTSDSLLLQSDSER